MASTSGSRAVRRELIRRLDSAVDYEDDDIRCENVKSVLSQTVERGDRLVDEQYLQTDREEYARHLLHLDPEGRYSVLLMVWAPGQGTPLHDHAGTWCVECVYSGQIEVTSYELQNDSKEEDVLQFEEQSEVISGLGDAGALIPPFEYHEINNTFDQKAVTIHVYAGEMTHCHAFYPRKKGAGYRRERKSLDYTSIIPGARPESGSNGQ